MESAETAWMTTAQACIDVSVSNDNAKIKSDCADVMVPLRDLIVTMGTLVDSWGSIDQQNYACALVEVVGGLQRAVNLVKVADKGFTFPQVIQDTFDLANMINLSCGGQVYNMDGGMVKGG